MFNARLPLKSLATICRSLSVTLHSGVAIPKAFQLAAGRSQSSRAQAALNDVAESLREGRGVAWSLRRQGQVFPPLLIDMVGMAEQTGMLPEVLEHLAEHYEHNLKLRRTFLSSIAWPLFQLVAAIFIIAGLILLLGLIASFSNSEPLGLFWGLAGPKGAAIWLLATFGTIFGLYVLYQLLVRYLGGRRVLDPLLMRVPVLGSCLRSFAIARFSWAFYLTQQTGMPMEKSLDSSLRATANGAFMAASRDICDKVGAGEELTTALAESHLFPAEYIEMVYVGETSGTVPEMLHRLSPQFEEQARRSLALLAAALGWGVWMVVAGFIVFFIFRFFLWYIGMVEEAGRGI